MRCSSRTPSSRSSAAIRRLTVVFGIPSKRAAAVKLPASVTRAKIMDQMTQQNAAMVEETTAASRTLADESTQLKTLLSNFRLRGAEQRAGARYTRAA